MSTGALELSPLVQPMGAAELSPGCAVHKWKLSLLLLLQAKLKAEMASKASKPSSKPSTPESGGSPVPGTPVEGESKEDAAQRRRDEMKAKLKAEAVARVRAKQEAKS